MTWNMEKYLGILLMRSVTTLAHLSRSPSSCAQGIGKSIDGISKQDMVFHVFGWRLNHFGTTL